MAFVATRAGCWARGRILSRHLVARAVLVATLGLCAPALAQTPMPAQPQRTQASVQQRAAYDAAFQATLDKPSDPDTLTRFAQLAVEIGDIEGAISALERLLLIQGGQPEVKLELGVLYYRLGASDAAKMYLEAVRASPDASPQTRDRAEVFLKATGK